MKTVRQAAYTGTIESYNEMVSKMGWNYFENDIRFIDKEGQKTIMFTGVFVLYPDMIRYKPGDHYHYEISDDAPVDTGE